MITLSAIVRNFRADHPDFETEKLTFEKDDDGNLKRDRDGKYVKWANVESGIVNTRLVKGKPVYNEDRTFNKSQTITSQASFQQWFSDDHADQIALNLDFRFENGIYVFEDRAFFPVNQNSRLWNELFSVDGESLTEVGQAVLRKIRDVDPEFGQGMSDVNALKQRYDRWEARERNYHFTLEAETTFTYRGDEEFAFFGDDDLWIFIDDKLVIDLGGLHPPAGCMNLLAARKQSDQRVLVPGYLDLRLANPRNRALNGSNTLRLRLREDLGIQHADEYTELVLQVGKTYSMKLFYAERHTFEANCCFYTTLHFHSPTPVEPKPLPHNDPPSKPTAPIKDRPTEPSRDLPIWWDDPGIWEIGERIVCVTPIQTIVRREEEITIIRRVRKVEEIDASPTCPTGSTELNCQD